MDGAKATTRQDEKHFSFGILCSNVIFILDLTPGFNGLGKDNYKTRNILG